MQTTIYLIRHGEVYNPEGIIYGRLPNFGLSEKGKQEIEKTAEFLKDKQISQIYSSPMKRTKETAEIIQRNLSLPTVLLADEIIEGLTSYQGRKFSELDALQSEVYLKPLNPSDETIEQLAHRMQDFIATLIKQYPGKQIVAVSHGDPIMALKTMIEKRPLDFMSFKIGSPYVNHGEVYEIKSDDKSDTSIQSVFKPEI